MRVSSDAERCCSLLGELIRKWGAQLSRGISNRLIWFCSTPPLFFHRVWSRTESSPPTSSLKWPHTPAWGGGKKFNRGKDLAVENLCCCCFMYVSICCVCHTENSFFWFHSRRRKCRLTHSSLKSWWSKVQDDRVCFFKVQRSDWLNLYQIEKVFWSLLQACPAGSRLCCLHGNLPSVSMGMYTEIACVPFIPLYNAKLP